MSSYKEFQTSFTKRVDTTDSSKKPKSMVREKTITEERKKRRINWITFYRRNIHRFIEHYFGIKLYPYQIIWIYLMSISDSYVSICSRASGKSWLIAVFVLARAVLYPNSEIVVVSSTKEQAGIIVADKATMLRNDYPNIAREIRNITTNMNQWKIDLHNGSIIKIVAARDSARGKRSTLTIYEEFRLIDKQVLDSVIRPFSYIRQTPYLKLPEYKNEQVLLEEPKEMFISSAYHKGLWWYDETKKNIKAMLRGDNSGFIALDWCVAVKHNIKTASQIKREKSKMDEVSALEEYDNIPWGESASAYFKLSMFTKARNIKKAFYPRRFDELASKKKDPNALVKSNGEIRIISCDISTRAGKKNDLAITSCVRCLPTHKGYHRELVYLEAWSGENTISQATRIKDIFYDFDADFIVLDVANAGIAVLDQLGVISKNTERGVEYPPFTIMQHSSIDKSVYEELSKRTLGLNAIPVVYPITATAKLNSGIAVDFRDKLQKKMWSCLFDETTSED